MCGIVAYTGKKQAYNILLNGLRRMQYRGYDSAGISILGEGEIRTNKAVGDVDRLENSGIRGTTGMAHTRWATHGQATQENTHPHADCKNSIVIAHNGIIENYTELKQQLVGHNFVSQTDSEVIAHLMEESYAGSMVAAMMKTVGRLKGTYAICAMNKETEEIVVAKKDSPLVLGIGEDCTMASSDTLAIQGHADKVIFLEDGQMAALTPTGIRLFSSRGEQLQPEIKMLEQTADSIGKGSHKHFMLKEIMEQPEMLKTIFSTDIHFQRPGRVNIVACGTAYHAALIGKQLFEEIDIEATAETASEFRYRKFPTRKGDVFMAISQSGETADTLAALRKAKQLGMRTYALVNAPTSTMTREADVVIPTKAGTEIAVASTKAFLSQLAVLYLITHESTALKDLPDRIKTVLNSAEEIRKIAEKYKDCKSFLFLGRGTNYPVALEGALKLKEISYVHAEGYPAGEMKHGPIALVSKDTAIVAIAVRDESYEKMISNIQEVKAREGRIIAIATAGDENIKQHATDVIYVPQTDHYPFLTSAVMQLFAYYAADALGREIDKPRNLAKSVTVE